MKTRIKVALICAIYISLLQTAIMHELVKGTNPNYILGDRSYGKSGVRILHVVKEGEKMTKVNI